MTTKLPMGKLEMAELARKALDMTGPDAHAAVSWFFDTMFDQIGSGGKMVIKGFGTFSPRITPARDYKHPQTGVPLHVEERANVLFRPSGILIDRIRGR